MKQITPENAHHICRAMPIGWKKDTDWVYGYYVDCDLYASIRGDYFISPLQEFTNYFANRPRIIEIDPTTKCRCTGKQDENGVWVFEKDKVLDGSEETVEWHLDAWILRSFHPKYKGWRYLANHAFKVIGNTIEDNQ